jgi:hypothetical protein
MPSANSHDADEKHVGLVRIRAAGGGFTRGGLKPSQIIVRMLRASMSNRPANSNRKNRDKALLDEALNVLEKEAPERITRVIRWLRSPESRWKRVPLGILCIIASFFWFLPVVGIEFFPIGLLLIAQDVPFLRRPAAKLLLWLVRKWRALRARQKH